MLELLEKENKGTLTATEEHPHGHRDWKAHQAQILPGTYPAAQREIHLFVLLVCRTSILQRLGAWLALVTSGRLPAVFSFRDIL